MKAAAGCLRQCQQWGHRLMLAAAPEIFSCHDNDLKFADTDVVTALRWSVQGFTVVCSATSNLECHHTRISQ